MTIQCPSMTCHDGDRDLLFANKTSKRSIWHASNGSMSRCTQIPIKANKFPSTSPSHNFHHTTFRLDQEPLFSDSATIPLFTPCAHWFCVDCITAHLNSGIPDAHKCPYCRSAVCHCPHDQPSVKIKLAIPRHDSNDTVRYIQLIGYSYKLR